MCHCQDHGLRRVDLEDEWPLLMLTVRCERSRLGWLILFRVTAPDQEPSKEIRQQANPT